MDEKERTNLSRFTLQCMSMVILFLFVMFVGMGITNYGLKSMKGYRNPTYEQISQMTGTANGSVETEILGGAFSAIEKQKQLEGLRSFNVIEGFGRGLASFTQNIARFGTDTVIGKIKEIFYQFEE
ncbi:DUF3679 domain-containing protein [Bacillus sp. DX1.1]|uniref:DUF3679 domain-containing protein n=1 Tax=unclassified Bacillus (in: firmicutes) TaxID=185979 RepID=UPI002570BA0E|nr:MULTISPECIES: DUF3679 domain-containing protein [unclassified Bacillus (in: firmicutes)]MDM5156518.1 DUF3679 domain-containing protein [Bacillus sp. DX1.1]WJE84149.1 DUF3679 domain-containing protein [Bacillus sp. DX3.1]